MKILFQDGPNQLFRVDRYWIYPSIALLAFVLGLETANMFKKWIIDSGDAATWAGSVGSFLAFAGTIWVATEQTRQKREKELNEAVLAAARVLPLLVKYQIAVAKLRLKLRIGQSEEVEIDLHHSFEAVMNCCVWNLTDISPLTILPNNVAYHLEFIKAIVPDIISTYYEHSKKKYIWNPINESQELDIASVHLAMRACSARFNATLERVTLALEECAKIIPRQPNI